MSMPAPLIPGLSKDPSARPTIAVLSPGEMGSRVGQALRDAGARVVTCLAGRGLASARRAAEADLEVVSDLDEVVREAGLVISVVPPAAAEPLSANVAEAMRLAGVRPLYLDANAIGPETALRIASAIGQAGGSFVDGAIIGPARDVRGRTRFYLSGAHAEEAAALLHPPLNVSVIGHEPGQASAFKVLYAGLTKGLSALGVELLAGAERLGLGELLLEKYHAEHPGVASFWEHNLPGLPPNARRRAQEMVELAETLQQLGLTAHMATAAQAVLESVAERYEARGPSSDELAAVVDWWARNP